MGIGVSEENIFGDSTSDNEVLFDNNEDSNPVDRTIFTDENKDFNNEEFLEIPEKDLPPIKDPESNLNNIEEDIEESTQFSRGMGNLARAGRDIGKFITSGEIVTAPAQGIVSGLEEVTEFGKSIVEGGIEITGKGIDWVFDESDIDDKIISGLLTGTDVAFSPLIGSGDEEGGGLLGAVEEFIPDPETVTGALTSGISQFATGMILTRRVTGLSGLKGNIINGAITDATFFDPFEGNISTLAKSSGGVFNNALTDALATNETQSEFVNRIRNGIEGLAFGGVIEVFGKAFRAAKATKNAKEEFVKTGEVSSGARKEMDEAIDDLENIDLEGSPKKEDIKKAYDKRKGKYDINRARANTKAEAADQKARAKATASDNREVTKDFIEEFEERLGKQISTRDAKGNITGLDFELARKVGKETTESLYGSKTRSFLDNVVGNKNVVDMDSAKGIDDTFSVILNPDKLDAITSVASDLKKRFPDAFKPKINPATKKKLRIVDHLFELSVGKDLKTDELIDTLGKYGLTYEDYVVSILGSASDAGRLLQRLSQLGRARPKSEVDELAQRSLMEAQNGIRQWVMRIENIRRGSLVSQLATAARNVTSAGIRMPLESLGNVMDTALYSLGRDGWGAGAKQLLSRQNWVDSFRGMGHFASLNMGGMYRKNREFTDMILEQPEFALQYDKMFNQLNEIRKHTRGPSGGVLDKVATKVEQGVDLLNTPNRMQEFMVRRVSFLSELERLVKREWNVDLIDTVGNGDLRKLTSDMSQFKPKGARSFIELVDSSVTKALDVTYAKQPDLQIFRDATNFITRNGLTTIIPFPRFMFNSLELVATYAGGASIPLTRKLLDMTKKGKSAALNEVERKLVTRNVMGLAGIIAAYQYRSDFPSMNIDEETKSRVDGDYKLLAFGDKRVDVTPQFPMRQYMWAGEAIKRIANGTFSDWYDHREAIQTFAGTNVRVGTGNVIFNDIAEIISSDDAVAGERMQKGFARAVGNYLSTFATPIAQIVEAQRAAGMRTMDYIDAADDPVLNTSDNFWNEFSRPFTARGFSNLFSPSSDDELPRREFLFSEGKQRPNPFVKGIFGINMFEKDEDYGQFFKELGYTEWKLGSRSKIPTQKRNENQVIRNILPAIANLGMALRSQYEADYDRLVERGISVGDLTKEKWVSSKLKVTLDKQLSRAKSIAGTVGEKDVSREAIAHDSWRKIPKNARSSAMTRFLEMKGRDPDLTNLKDMNLLIGIAKIVR